MDITDDWLSVATRIPSENCDIRPNNEISLLVVHCISLPAGHYGNGYVQQLFTNSLDSQCHSDFHDIRSLRVASHLFIRRDGEIQQFVPFQKRAWHAGESCFRGRSQCNDFSIGVELEGTDTTEFRDVQYEQLIGVCAALIKTYEIPLDHIVGHSDIAPGRKSDPGIKFDWARLKYGLSELRSK